MSETEIAPAPWDWIAAGRPSGHNEMNIYVVDANGRKIAAVYGKRGEKEKTIRLMAAAPKLLEALKSAKAYIADLERRIREGVYASDDFAYNGIGASYQDEIEAAIEIAEHCTEGKAP